MSTIVRTAGGGVYTERTARWEHEADLEVEETGASFCANATAKARAPPGQAVGEHRKLHRGVIEAGKLETPIGLGPGAVIAPRRHLVAVAEIVEHPRPPPGIIDGDETPGLGIAHRRRQTGRLDQAINRIAGHRAWRKAADIAAPHQQFIELVAEIIIESGRRRPPIGPVFHGLIGHVRRPFHQ